MSSFTACYESEMSDLSFSKKIDVEPKNVTGEIFHLLRFLEASMMVIFQRAKVDKGGNNRNASSCDQDVRYSYLNLNECAVVHTVVQRLEQQFHEHRVVYFD